MSLIPFAPPRIDDLIVEEVIATLRSGWITTGPRTKQFEKNLSAYNGNPVTLCLNSATAGMEIMLRWFGVKEGDEVILPAYTYAATANVIVHCGATPVFVDISTDFNISISAIERAITPRTKVIMPVDFGGLPCDYDAIMALVKRSDVVSKFNPTTTVQEQMGRMMVLSDAAHSLGAKYKGRKAGTLADVSVFSFHAVKNLPTAEGGAVALNLPAPFEIQEVYKYLCIYTLHGQTKDALSKMQKGNWRYDIIEAGFKCNMTDLMAAIGMIELARYDEDMLVQRKQICMAYRSAFANEPWAELPTQIDGETVSSWHLFALRIKGITEAQRDEIIQLIFDQDVSVNVHFIPLPMLSFYKNRGYSISNYPNAFDAYSREISLPVFYALSVEEIDRVIKAVKESVEKVISKKA